MALTKFNYNSFDVTPVASKAMGFNSDVSSLKFNIAFNMLKV